MQQWSIVMIWPPPASFWSHIYESLHHCITESADGVWTAGGGAPPSPGDWGPSADCRAILEWLQECRKCRLDRGFSNTGSFYFVPHTHNKHRALCWSLIQILFLHHSWIGHRFAAPRPAVLQWLHHDAGTQHCSLQLHAASRAGSRSATAGTHQYYARITMQWTVFILYPSIIIAK